TVTTAIDSSASVPTRGASELSRGLSGGGGLLLEQRNVPVFGEQFSRRDRPPQPGYPPPLRAGPGRGQRRSGLYLARRRGLCPVRSEEHTSELQSRENLVCRRV